MVGKARGRNGSPPIKPVDWTLFEQLCALQCTQQEMASMLKVDEDTLRAKVKEHYDQDYSAVYKTLSASGKCSLRRYQFVQAKTKPNMAIWLGKQWLDQRDHPQELTEFNGKLAEILTKLTAVDGEKDFKKDGSDEAGAL